MRTFRTHYDTLKVAQDAPGEVIQAAYRSLARKYHPDHAGGSPEGEAMMKAINASYEVLSDPARRAQYDQWIASQQDNYASSRRTTHGWGKWGDSHTADSAKASPRSRNDRTLSLEKVMVAVACVALALFLLRLPGLPRLIGVGVLLAGWFVLLRRQ